MGPMRRMFQRHHALFFVAATLASSARAQIVHGQVDSVGFQTSGGYVLREGQWFPLLVSLQVQGSQVFAGQIRAEARDLDGDRVSFTQPQVTVTGDGPLKRVWCYALINSVNELPGSVSVVDEQSGAVGAELPLPLAPPFSLLNDDLLVLDLSYPQVTALNELQSPGWSPGQPTENARRFYRNVAIAHLPPADLPDRWWGLEAVDVIVWDCPDPAALSIAQHDALTAWVHNGGQLVVGIGATWGALSKSDLAPILPLAGEGETTTIQKLDVLFRRTAPPEWKRREFRDPIPVTLARPAEGAFRTLGDFGPRNEAISLITMRLVGSGRVVATAASLRDLTGAPLDKDKFFAALLDLNTYSDDYAKNQISAAVQFVLPNYAWLYDDFIRPVAFSEASALRGVTVLLFVAVYVLVATLASWWWLRRRGLTAWSWALFAGFAAAGGALSLGTVGALRGFAGGVQSLNILDVEGGANSARGFCAFGYRSPIRQQVELSLPGEENFLRPLTGSPRGTNYYSTAARYSCVPARATLKDVLLRATLKQVEGYWHGQLDGVIRGDLTADRRTGRLTAASWLANDLAVDLQGGFLLLIDPRLDDGTGVPWRAAGLTTPYLLPEVAGGTPDLKSIPPAANILAVRIPAIPAGQQIRELGRTMYAQVDQNWVNWAQRPNRKRSEMFKSDRDLRTLWTEQQSWADNSVLAVLRANLDATLRAVLLASTRNYHLPNRTDDFSSVGTPLRSDGLPNLDLTHWLLRGQAVLIGWSDTPGPARLQRGGLPLDPYRGLTVYRVRLSLAYEGRPPRGEAEP
jgi:hypothetical protein